MQEQGSEVPRWTRGESAEHLAGMEGGGVGQRGYARQSSVPRTTLQYWLSRKASLEGDPEVVAFFESPTGVAFLHRMMVALFFVFDFVSSSGLRSLQGYLELAGLSPFVASSYGSCQRLSTAMETAVRGYAAGQREALVATMAPKRMTVCQDETFHPEVCLVAIEPVSDFILLEGYSEKRDAASWSAAMEGALKGLPVTVMQATSDEGKGLLAHAREGLGAHHSPDLFHIQRELSRATSVGLSAQVKHTEEAVQKATVAAHGEREAQRQWEAAAHGPGRPPDFPTRIALGELAQREVVEAWAEALHRQSQAREAIRGLSADYHPLDLNTGNLKSPEQVKQELEKRFAAVQEVALAAQLPERCHKGITKARRLLDAMVCTVAFFHREVAERLDALELPAEVRQAAQQKLLPQAYLRRVAARAHSAETRKLLLQKAEGLAQSAQPETTLDALTPEQRAGLDRVVGECADVFQRSSSCVEGRNGQLALRHHSLHRLSTERLEALTAVHNYFVPRRDGSTAAERFFGRKPDDLFAHLLDHLDLPARPSTKRSRPPDRQLLN